MDINVFEAAVEQAKANWAVCPSFKLVPELGG